MGNSNSWPVVGTVTDPVFQASVTAALAAKADAVALIPEADLINVVAAAAALRLLGCEEGWAADFKARSGAVVAFDGAKSAIGWPDAMATFTRPSTGTVVGRNRLRQSSAANVLRYTHDDASGAPTGVRLEPAATNFALQSSNLSTSHSFGRASPAPNVTTAPDGTTTADKLVEDATTANTHYAYSEVTTGLTLSSPISTARSWKAGERTKVRRRIQHEPYTSDYAAVDYDLVTGTVSAVTLGGAATNGSARMVREAYGFWRCELTVTLNGANTNVRTYDYLLDGSGNATYDGDNASGAFCWGLQTEQGPCCTSLIETTTATATRSADIFLIPAAKLPVIAGQISGLIEFSIDALATSQRVMAVSDGTSNNRVEFFVSSGTNVAVTVTNGGVNSVNGATVATALAARTVYRLAFSMSDGDFRAKLTGQAQLTQAPASVPTTLDRAYLFTGSTGTPSYVPPGVVSKAWLASRRLTDAELAAAVA